MARMQRDIYDEDHEDFRASVRQWLERSVIPNTDKYIAEKALPREFWLEAGANGFLGLSIPEEYGGAGAGDFRFNAILEEELAKIGAAYPTCVGIHVDITAPYIVELGTPEQKERWLPGVASGEILLAIGMTEPGGGSDLAALKTTAVRDGDEWVINGSKTFITNGYSADLIVVAARTDPRRAPRASPSSASRRPRRASAAAASSTRSAWRSPTPPSSSSPTSASPTPRSSAS